MRHLRLFNKTKNDREVANFLVRADTFFARLKGLLGEKTLDRGAALLIVNCRSIHTCFMNFAIDAVFVDKNFVVRKTYRNIRPWRVTRIIFSAHSVIELAAGTLDETTVEIGDQLYVGD